MENKTATAAGGMGLKQKTDVRLMIGLVSLCFCMRAPMSAVGPLVSQIKETLQLSAAFSGLLTTIPLLLFAAAATFTGRLLSRVSVTNLFCCCAAAVLAGVLLRSYGGLWGLLGGTALLGVGIGILNVSIPVWIRHSFRESIGLGMAVYSTAMTALSAVAAGVCVSLSVWLSGWQNAMAVFSLFALIALPVWRWCVPAQGRTPLPEKRASFGSVCRSFSDRCVALFMGLQSAIFFVLVAWLPSILGERGMRASAAGMMVLLFQTVSLLTNFLMPLWFQRYPRRRRLLAASCAAAYGAGFALLLFSAGTAALAASVVLIGLASGLSLSFALTVISTKGKNSGEAVALSSFAQCVGYLIAAPAPFLMGALFDAVGSFRLPTAVLLLLCVPLLIFGVGTVPRRTDAETADPIK